MCHNCNNTRPNFIPTQDQVDTILAARRILRRAYLEALQTLADDIRQSAPDKYRENSRDALVGAHYLTTRFSAIFRHNIGGHVLAVSADNPSQVSYARTVEDRYNSKRRARLSFARYLRKYAPGIAAHVPEYVLSIFCGAIASRLGADRGEFIKHTGRDIVDAYLNRPDGESCMAGGCGAMVESYAHNPDSVALLEFKRIDGNGDGGRALLWQAIDADGAPVMLLDRYYGDADCQAIFNNYARAHGIYRRENDSAPSGRCVSFADTRGNLSNRFTVPDFNFPEGRAPYLDSLHWGRETSRDNDSATYTLQTSATGTDYSFSDYTCDCVHCGSGTGNLPGFGGTCCDACGEILRDEDDDSICSEDGTPYCYNCYSERYTRCECCDTETPIDDSRYVESEGITVCTYCADHDYTHCDGCSELFPNDNIITTDGGNVRRDYCQDCACENTWHCETCGETFDNDSTTEQNISENTGACSCDDCHNE